MGSRCSSITGKSPIYLIGACRPKTIEQLGYHTHVQFVLLGFQNNFLDQRAVLRDCNEDFIGKVRLGDTFQVPNGTQCGGIPIHGVDSRSLSRHSQDGDSVESSRPKICRLLPAPMINTLREPIPFSYATAENVTPQKPSNR